ncbi:hypothetical protein SESBI_01610 [Sesbania bispinosa]|nr:hypothetical protein SESBI_01610 [Sesbania bispinosa]
MGAAAREKRHSRRGATVTTAHGGTRAAGRKRAVAQGLAFTGRRRSGYGGKVVVRDGDRGGEAQPRTAA